MRSIFALLVLLSQIQIQTSAQSGYSFLENGNPIVNGLDAGFLLDSPTRKKIDLSGMWSYSVTDGPEGVVKVPSAYDFTGEVTFERSVQVDAADLEKYQFSLVMLGSNYNTSVTINKDFIGNHIGGYTTFWLPIPSSVLQVGKENIVRITTNNTLDPTKTLPLKPQVWGWRNYGGILRDVFLVGTPKVYITDVVATSELNSDFSQATVTVTASFDSDFPSAADTASSSLKFLVELFDKQTYEPVATSQVVPVAREKKKWKSVAVTLSVAAPRLWSPETPDRYFIKAHLVDGTTGTPVDDCYINTGIRKVEIRDGHIVLNGKRIMLKGLLWVEDYPSFGSAMTLQQMEKDVALIRSAGANAIRFGFHPPHPYMLSLCDRYGLLALEELPVKSVPAEILASEYYIDLAANRLRETIVRDRNHPSVLAWGLGDDFESWAPAARSFVEPLVQLARTLDTRPVYYCAAPRQADTCSDLVDFVAATVMTRDMKQFKQELADLREAGGEKPVIIGKMGSEVQPGNHNGYSDPISYEGQARYMTQHIEAAKAAGVDGMIIWSFNDWKGDRPSLTIKSGDPWMHTLGIVSYAREKRIAYDAVRTAFNGEKFSALPIGSMPASSPIVYVLTGLVLLVGTAYLYNANRRFREALNRSMVNSYNFFADVRDQRIVTIWHSTLLGLIVSAGTAIVTSSLLYHFRSSIVLDNLLSFILASDRVKEIAVRLILDPREFLVAFTVVWFLLLVLVSLLLWGVAPLFKARIYLFHAYATTMWSTPPLLVLVPLGMILFRLMDSPVYVLPAIILVALLFVWVWWRFLKGVSIILDMHPAKVYLAGIVSVLGLLAVAYFYMDKTESAFVYMKYFYNDVVTRGQ